VAKGLKGFERKVIKAQKTVCGFPLLRNKNHRPGFVKDSSSFCWDHFLPLLFFFPCYEHSFICECHLWFDNILLSFDFFPFLFFAFFSLCFFLERFWYVPWTEFQFADDFVWGIFLKEKLFWAQRGYNGKSIDHLGW